METEPTNIIGIDLGGTKSVLVRYDAQDLSIQKTVSLPSHAGEAWDNVYMKLLEGIQKLQTKQTLGIGIGVPGFVRKKDGVVVALPNIADAKNISLKKDLENSTGVPVCINNDANIFALAEALHSPYAHEGVVVGITLGTGVGGGIVIDGQLLRGANGFAAEVGHMLLQPGHPPFETDDKRGEVEQFLSGTAFSKRCSAAGSPKDYLEGEACAPMHEDIIREAAWMCVNLHTLLDTSLIIFGGSAGKAMEKYLPAIAKEIEQWLPSGLSTPQLQKAALEDSATRGAALSIKECI